jgi:hypothetical protein
MLARSPKICLSNVGMLLSCGWQEPLRVLAEHADDLEVDLKLPEWREMVERAPVEMSKSGRVVLQLFADPSLGGSLVEDGLIFGRAIDIVTCTLSGDQTMWAAVTTATAAEHGLEVVSLRELETWPRRELALIDQIYQVSDAREPSVAVVSKVALHAYPGEVVDGISQGVFCSLHRPSGAVALDGSETMLLEPVEDACLCKFCLKTIRRKGLVAFRVEMAALEAKNLAGSGNATMGG